MIIFNHFRKSDYFDHIDFNFIDHLDNVDHLYYFEHFDQAG